MNTIIIGIVIYFLAVFFSRYISERSTKTLSAEQKVDMIDKFKPIRIYYLGVVVFVLIAYLLIMQFGKMDFYTGYIVFIAAFVVASIAFTFLSFKKLKENNFPPQFIRTFVLARLINFAGLAVAIFFVFLSMQDLN